MICLACNETKSNGSLPSPVRDPVPIFGTVEKGLEGEPASSWRKLHCPKTTSLHELRPARMKTAGCALPRRAQHAPTHRLHAERGTPRAHDRWRARPFRSATARRHHHVYAAHAPSCAYPAALSPLLQLLIEVCKFSSSKRAANVAQLPSERVKWAVKPNRDLASVRAKVEFIESLRSFLEKMTKGVFLQASRF